MRSIDHLVLPVTTLGLARSRLTGLGFTVAPDARHPFGTGNCCVFFGDGAYLEPITILDRDAADQAAAQGVFFVRRIKRFMERLGEGFAMAALKSGDAEADNGAFERAGVSAGDTYFFSRPTVLDDGSAARIGVTLAYAAHRSAPEAAFFACQHSAADLLFQPRYLTHPNGAKGVSAIIAVADDPARFADYLSAAVGAPAEPIAEGVQAASGAARIAIVAPAAFKAEYGFSPPAVRRGLILSAFELLVENLDRAATFAGASARRLAQAIVLPPSPGVGCVMALRECEHGGA